MGDYVLVRGRCGGDVGDRGGVEGGEGGGVIIWVGCGSIPF